MSQSQPLRIEHPEFGSFTTSRTINSALWFINNWPLEERILGYLAKYQEKYQVPLYAFVFHGSHFHTVTKFPQCNRARFFRDLNARAAEAVRALAFNFPGGPVFERRYSEQALPSNEDIETQFFYCALQPIEAGLVENLSDYPGYNSFYDAISGTKRMFRTTDWARYNEAKKKDPGVKLKDFVTFHALEYSRLPGYEGLTQKAYRKLMLRKFEEKRQEIVAAWKAKEHKFMTRQQLLEQIPGTPAKNPKKSKRYDYRPLVLTACPELKRRFLEWYFSVYAAYKVASRKYLAGDVGVPFPPGTYRPPGLCMPV